MSTGPWTSSGPFGFTVMVTSAIGYASGGSPHGSPRDRGTGPHRRTRRPLDQGGGSMRRMLAAVGCALLAGCGDDAGPSDADSGPPGREQPVQVAPGLAVVGPGDVVIASDADIGEIEEIARESGDGRPFEESVGGALSDAPFEGPTFHGVFGVGGDAGGPFRERAAPRPSEASILEGTRDDALADELRWLAAHQSDDGRWESAGFGAWCNGRRVQGEGPDGAGGALHDVGLTGLALLNFLASGYTHRGDHAFAKVVRNGLR